MPNTTTTMQETSEATEFVKAISSEQWDDRAFPSMSEAKRNFTAVIVTEKIVVIGGSKLGPAAATERISHRNENKRRFTNYWEKVPKMGSERQSFGAAVVTCEEADNIVVVAGGALECGDALSCARRYDCATNKWIRLPDMQHRRIGCAMTCRAGVDGVVYVVGGTSDYVGTVEYCNVASVDKSWKLLSPRMKVGRSYCAAVMVRKCEEERFKLVVMGGQTKDGGVTSAVECYDFLSREWIALPPMNQPRQMFAAVVSGSCIFVIGGRGQADEGVLDSVELFDWRTTKWTLLPHKLNTPREGCAAVVAGSKIFVMGGTSLLCSFLRSVEVLRIPDTAFPKLPRISGNAVGRVARTEALEKWCATAEPMITKAKTELVTFKERIRKEKCEAFCTAHEDLEEAMKVATVEYEEKLRAATSILDKKKNLAKRKYSLQLAEAQGSAEKRSKSLAEKVSWITDAKVRLAMAREELHLLQSVPAAPVVSPSKSDEQQHQPQKASPPEMVCPLTKKPIVDPVFAAGDGHIYERSAIEGWLSKYTADQEPMSPVTRAEMSSRQVFSVSMFRA